MKYKWIEDIAEFKVLANEWDDVVISNVASNPFFLSDFIITWWKYYNENKKLSIFVVYKADRIIGGIPLFLNREDYRYGFVRVLRYIGAASANYTEPFYGITDFEMAPIFTEALAKRRDWDVMHLTDVRADSQLIKECNNIALNSNFLMTTLQDHANLFIDLSCGSDRFYKDHLTRKMRKELKAKRKYAVNNYGLVELKEITTQGDIKKYFDIYVKFSSESFNSRDKKSTFDDPNQSAFYKELLLQWHQRHLLDAYFLLAGDKILAVIFGYRFDKNLNWVLTAFDYKYKYIRPGYLLIEELIKEIINRGGIYCNCYGYSSFYKSQWCNKEQPLYQFFLINKKRWGPLAKGLFYKTLKVAKSRIKSNAKLFALMQHIKKIKPIRFKGLFNGR